MAPSPGAMLLVAIASALAGCQSGRAVDLDFELLAPAAPVELVPIPGDFVDVTWRHDAADAAHLGVIVYAVPTAANGAEAVLAVTPLASGGARYVVPPVAARIPMAAAIPAGVYQATASVYDDDGVLAEDTAPGLLVMQGARFRDAELTFTSELGQRDIWMTTVTATVVRATVSLTDVAGGPRQVISQGTIASDLAPVGRVVTFTGRTIDDVAIAAGDYQAVIELSARGGTVTYEQGGLTIHWRP